MNCPKCGKEIGKAEYMCHECGYVMESTGDSTDVVKMWKAMDEKILARGNSKSFVKMASSLNRKMKSNLLPVIVVISAVLFVAVLFMTGDCKISYGTYSKTQTVSFVDMIFTFGSAFSAILRILIGMLLVIVTMFHFVSKVKLSGIAFKFSAFVAILEVIFAITTIGLNDFKAVSSGLTCKYTYPATGMIVGIIIAALLLFAGSFMAYMVEREKRYLLLTKFTGENK